METANIVEAENIPEIEQELLEVVNQHRLSLGQNSLEFSSVAYLLANEHTDYMMTVGSLNHDNFSKRASTISTEVDAEFVAENVAKDYLNASEAFSGWLTSSSHKKTMEGEFTHTAVSVKRNEEGNLFYTQIFFR
ncbi:CAP domain-containing protein [Euzebyella marina]|nr:CAP domain-containing protein [Euzebyella marina]|tara:strand:- start:6829 stop:7233 length:405 start_codon:yes stop_codon:yes gene_type:complete